MGKTNFAKAVVSETVFKTIIDHEKRIKDLGTNDNVSFRTNRHGTTDLGTMIFQENSTGSWLQLGSYSQTNSDGNSGTVWSY